jgi:short-subunit dehydrogenase
MSTAVNHTTMGTAVVTGASSGIGKMYADRLAARGYDLLLIARRADRLKAIAADLETRFGIRVKTLAVDLAQPSGLSQAVDTIASDASVTLLVNNAGTSVFGPSGQASQEVLTNIVALNITALTSLTNAILARFQERGSGTIINIGSVVGFAGYPLTPIYGGTKAYVLNFTQALQQQVAGTGIRVQLVTPASTVSEIWAVMGVDVSDLDPATVMSTENCVDAALCGLDSGELITAPSVHDETLLRSFEAASLALLGATQNGQPAPRYGL